MRETLPHLLPSDFPEIRRDRTETLQVNLGYRCNQQCLHCHVAAGPNRKEMMARTTIELLVETLSQAQFNSLDLTGGAPELHPDVRWLVTQARAMGLRVIDRCNLTLLLEPDQQDLPEFLAGQRVEIVASLPCYLEENVDRQRGQGVFTQSLEALRLLNGLGYGDADGALAINLVYNPQFNRLLALANLPIQRFGSTLLSTGQFHDYVTMLKSSHRPENVDGVMCRSLVSVDWLGYLYDCDFNQMLKLPLNGSNGSHPHLRDLAALSLPNRRIRVADHCHGCTAGQGSSCGGALAVD